MPPDVQLLWRRFNAVGEALAEVMAELVAVDQAAGPVLGDAVVRLGLPYAFDLPEGPYLIGVQAVEAA